MAFFEEATRDRNVLFMADGDFEEFEVESAIKAAYGVNEPFDSNAICDI
jgi:hypothetical protein